MLVERIRANMELRREVKVLRIQGLLTDRRPLIEALESETGKAAGYSGAPSFRYQVGGYTVLRDGSIEVPEEKADDELLRHLAQQGLIAWQPEQPAGISFDAASFTGRTMANIVKMLSAKERLINKAIGVPNAFHMKADFVRELKDAAPSTMDEFRSIMSRFGGTAAMKGIWLSGEQLIFTGFPETEACRNLAEHIVATAVRSRWIKSGAAECISEKYSFRVWLNSLGMKGSEYKQVRAKLLKNLAGDSSFRTREQRDAFEKKRRNAVAPEPEFILL